MSKKKDPLPLGVYNDRVSNFVKIYRYEMGDSTKYKFVYMPSCKKAGYELLKDEKKEGKVKKEKEYYHEVKFEESISRAKKMIFNFAMCNDWEWFFTGTLSPDKYDRCDLQKFHKDFTKWVGYLNDYYNLEIKYLIIPELHEDMKAWHLHGFFMGLPDDFLRPFKITEYLPYKILDRVKSGIRVCDFPRYSKKFGFCDLEPIKDKFAVSAYCTKYITKDLLKSVKDVGAHTYYHSRGLKCPDVELLGCVNDYNTLRQIHNMNFDSNNEYCKVKWIDSDVIDILKDRIEVKYWK